MHFKTAATAALAAAVLAACGGSTSDSASSAPVSKLAAATVVNDTATFSGSRASVSISRTDTGFTATDSSGTTTLSNVKTLKFTDVTINLSIGDKARSLNAADLKILIELYVAFFNRVPDADGLGYWIDQFRNGMSIDEISNSFYTAAVQYSSLTGYASTMSNADFVKVIYKNVLGRSGTTAPPDDDVNFWAGLLAKGTVTKGSLIRTMLGSAHSFTGDATWGWVPQLLDNKVTVANHFAVQQGLNYNTPEDSISKTMAMAAAITPTDTTAAKAMIGFTDDAFNLSQPVLSGVAARAPMNNATVTVYNVNADGSKGSALASSTIGSGTGGKFSVVLSSQPSGPVQVEVSGGSYTSGYDGTTVNCTSKISSIVDSVSSAGQTGLSVTPLSTMATTLTKTLVAQGYSVTASHQGAETLVAWQYGLKSAPSKIVPKFDVNALESDTAAAHMGMLLLAMDTLGKRLSPSDPDAVVNALASDFADAVFDGKASGQSVTLNGGALASNAGSTQFLNAYALSNSATGAGLRPGYVDAHFKAGTITENYQAKLIPVYVAQELASSYKPLLSSPVSKAASFDASAAGYSCSSGAQVTFSANGTAMCGQGAYYTCYNATVITTSTGVKCSDGGIPIYHSAEIPLYTAPAIKTFTATDASTYLGKCTVGNPAVGTIPVYTATAVHPLTQAERDAMMANDKAAGDVAAARISALGTPTPLQMEWLEKINNAVMASVGH